MCTKSAFYERGGDRHRDRQKETDRQPDRQADIRDREGYADRQ